MKQILKIAITLSLLTMVLLYLQLPAPEEADSPSANQQIIEAFEQRKSDVIVTGIGVVDTILKDDTKGRKHQRFIVEIKKSMTILVAHNIDLAPRINNLQTGDTVEFKGEYEWNKKGGVIHWTHRDPAGRHPHGWIKHKNTTYR